MLLISPCLYFQVCQHLKAYNYQKVKSQGNTGYRQQHRICYRLSTNLPKPASHNCLQWFTRTFINSQFSTFALNIRWRYSLGFHDIYIVLYHLSKIQDLQLGYTCYCILLLNRNISATPWIEDIRSYRIGGLILGLGFKYSDSMCCTAGVFIDGLIDFVLLSHRLTKNIQLYAQVLLRPKTSLHNTYERRTSLSAVLYCNHLKSRPQTGKFITHQRRTGSHTN